MHRLIVATNDLIAINGHAFNLALGLREELAHRGVGGEIWSHRDLDTALAARLDARRVFSEEPIGLVRPASRNASNREWLRRVFAYRKSLSAAWDRSGDPILVTNAGEAECLGLALWLAGIRGGRPRHLLVHFMVGPTDPARSAAQRWRYRIGLRLLRRVAGRTRVHLSTGAEELSAQISSISGQRAKVRPMAKAFPPGMHEVITERPRPIVVSMLGTPRPEKGLHLVPGIARRLAASGLSCRFEVHATHVPRWAPAGLLAELRETPTVEFEVAQLSEEDYHRRLLRADIVLLPYNPASFAARTSGIFAEAAAAGIPAVAPARTWTGDQLQGLGTGTLYGSWDEASVAEALMEACHCLPELSARAVARAPEWRASQGMGGFVDSLLADLEGTGHGRGE